MSTRADVGLGGSNCAHIKLNLLCKARCRKQCLEMDLGCITGNQPHLGKEIALKDENTVCGPSSLAEGGLGVVPSHTHGTMPSRTLPDALRRKALHEVTTTHTPWKVNVQPALRSPSDSGNTSSVDLRLQLPPEKAAVQSQYRSPLSPPPKKALPSVSSHNNNRGTSSQYAGSLDCFLNPQNAALGGSCSVSAGSKDIFESQKIYTKVDLQHTKNT